MSYWDSEQSSLPPPWWQGPLALLILVALTLALVKFLS